MISGRSERSLTGTLNIYDNPVLERLGLDGLETTSVLDVYDNPSLPNCEGYGLLDRLDPKPGTWHLSGNKSDNYPDCP